MIESTKCVSPVSAENLTAVPVGELVDAALSARTLLQGVPRLLQVLKQVERQVEAQSSLLEALAQQQTLLLENASEQQKALTDEHYSRHIVEPLARGLFPLVDLTMRFQSGASAELARAMRSSLIDQLARLGVDRIPGRPGQVVSRQTMRATKLVPTAKRSQHQTIVEIKRLGFWRDQRVLRYHEVAVYVYKPVSSVRTEGRT